jgi:hypothetical protein
MMKEVVTKLLTDKNTRETVDVSALLVDSVSAFTPWQ